jgi:hypothetical protein
MRMGGDGDGSGSFPIIYFCIRGVEYLGSVMLLQG